MKMARELVRHAIAGQRGRPGGPLPPRHIIIGAADYLAAKSKPLREKDDPPWWGSDDDPT